MPFIAYKSSAGSGKTFTLVKEYIKICIANPENFRHILAITFTNKAANEMKERIIAYLTQLSSSPSENTSNTLKFLLADLIAETGLTEDIICKRSKQVVDLILHNYSDFAISTIDSFVHRIIRIFAHDLKLPLNFEVEMDVEKLLREAIDLMISKTGTDENLTRILVDFSESKTDEEKSWQIESDLFNFAKQFLRDDSAPHLETIRKLSISDFLEIRKKLISLSLEFEKSVIRIAEGAMKEIIENNISIDSFSQGKNGIGGFFLKISRGKIDKATPNRYVIDTIDNNKWHSGICSKEDKDNIDRIRNFLATECRKIIALLDKNYKNYVLYNLVLVNIYPLAVLSEIEKVMDELKKENNIIPINEFNEKISRIVTSQPVPFIYERIGEKYQNYFIDEFQDTSALQWTNLLPLIENSLAYDFFNLIVGDGKQAIYRWRGGDVEQFAMLPEIPESISDLFSKERAEAIQRNYSEQFLTSNFRSKAEIVEFNNNLFGHIREKCQGYLQNIYDHCEQQYNPENTGGYVQIDFTDITSVPEELDYSTIMNTKILEVIHQSVKSNFNFSDITVLCRRNKDASSIARFLISRSIPVISDESLLLEGSPDIGFLNAFATFSINNNDTLAKYHILHFLFTTRRLKGSSIYDIVNILGDKKEKISTKKLRNYLSENNLIYDLDYLGSLPVYEFFKEISVIFGLNLINNPHLQFFLDSVHEFSSRGKNSLSAFKEWWETEKFSRSVIIPEGTEAVRIMTIHKSKGLEFPVVIFPFAHISQKSSNDFLWIKPDIKDIPRLKSTLVRKNKQLLDTDHAETFNNEVSKTILDTLNIMYVALTRASERLYILTQKPSEDLSEPQNIPDFIASYLEATGLWRNDQSVYAFGKETRNYLFQENKFKLSPVSLNSFSRKARKQTIHLRKRSAIFWEADNPEKNTEWGNTVHYVLSKIQSAMDVEKVLNEIIRDGLIQHDVISEFKSRIQSIVNHPKLAEFFMPEAEVMNESEIIMADGRILRPDRVAVINNKSAVIEYKTGSPKEEHIEQIKGYASALIQLGYSEVRKFLVYINSNKIEEINS